MSYQEMEILRLEKENAALRKALKPFAEWKDTPKNREVARKVIAKLEKTK